MLGLLIYLPNTIFVPQWFFVVAGFVSLWRVKNLRELFTKRLFLISMFVALQTMVWIFYFLKNGQIGFPWFWLFLLVYIIQSQIREQDVKMIVGLGVLESIVVLIEFFSGRPSLFLDVDYAYIDSALLYFRRPFGFADNSSICAISLLLAYMLVPFSGVKSKLSILFRLFLISGMILTFTRAVLLALVVYEIIRVFVYRDKFSTLCIFLGLTFVFFTWENVMLQLMGGGGDGLSGRSDIWLDVIQFIERNPLLGMGGGKFYAYEFGVANHAHNSFLVLVSSFGILLSSVYVFFLLYGIPLRRLLLVLPILVCGLFQYIVFWGISLADIIFMLFIFNSRQFLLERVDDHRYIFSLNT